MRRIHFIERRSREDCSGVEVSRDHERDPEANSSEVPIVCVHSAFGRMRFAKILYVR